jgi:hypothetical protein
MRGMIITKEERAQLTMLELVLPEAREEVVPNFFGRSSAIDRFMQTKSITGGEINGSDTS